jgi:hypothetical protein
LRVAGRHVASGVYSIACGLTVLGAGFDRRFTLALQGLSFALFVCSTHACNTTTSTM